MKSSTPWDSSARTPFDGQEWPEQLDARVVDGSRIHGYDAPGDLAQNYSYAEVLLLALTRELPSREVGRAFELALVSLAPTSVAEAPAHAGVLARVCDGAPRAVIAVSAIALAEQAHHSVTAHATWLDSLGAGEETIARDKPVESMCAAIAQFGVNVPGLNRAVTIEQAALAVFRACGLTHAEQLESAWVLAKLGVAISEALAGPAGRYKEYPVKLPHFRYTEDE